MPAELPDLFDAHIHPETLSDQDLETMRYFGVRAVLAVAHHDPIEKSAKHVLQHFDDLLARQLPRIEKAGIRAYVGLGVHPQAIPRRGLPEILSALPGYFRGGKVVAVGEVGLHRGSELEEEAMTEQLLLARRLKLPVIVHTPHRSKEALTRRALTLIRDSAVVASRVLVDHASDRTVRPILECGHFAGLTVHPDELEAEAAVRIVNKLGTDRVVLNSDSGDGAGDIVGLARAARLLEKAELSPAVVARVTYKNAARFLRIDD